MWQNTMVLAARQGSSGAQASGLKENSVWISDCFASAGQTHALSELGEVLIDHRGGHHVLDAIVRSVHLEVDDTLLTQGFQSPVRRGGRHVYRHAHGLKHRDFLTRVPDRRKQIQQALFNRVQRRKTWQSANGLNETQELELVKTVNIVNF